MKTLISKVRIQDASSPHHGKTKDVLLSKGKILKVAAPGSLSGKENTEEIDGRKAFLSTGWIELHSDFADPGYEEREDLESGAGAAATGGYTQVALWPDTLPIVDTKADIQYLLKKSDELPVKILPIASASSGLKGTDLSEMFDLKKAGATAFTTGKDVCVDPRFMLNALLYSKTISSPLFMHAVEPGLARDGQMHEGKISTYLGLRPIPAVAEEIALERILSLVRYTGVPVHITSVSTAGSVKMLRKAKKDKLPVSCDVNIYNLLLTDEALTTYDSNFKLSPPLREKSDQRELIKGLEDGTLDALAADHRPLDIERKKCEFTLAGFGMAYIEHAVPLLLDSELLSTDTLIEKLTAGPRKVLGLELPSVEEGQPAELTLFAKGKKLEIKRENLKSRAWNHPFAGREVSHRVLRTFL